MKRKHRGRKHRFRLLDSDRWIAPIITWFESIMAKIEGLEWNRGAQEKMHATRAAKWQERIKKEGGIIETEEDEEILACMEARFPKHSSPPK